VVLHQGKIIFDGDVEEAIGIYMQNEIRDLSSDIDLTPAKHIVGKTDFQFSRFQFLNPNGARLKQREKLYFRMTIHAKSAIEGMRFRAMAAFADGTATAMTTTKENAMTIVPGDNVFEGEINTGNLAPGAYFLKFALYQTNEFGGERIYDCIEHAAHFTIEDTRSVNRMAWNHPKWGNTSLDDIEIYG
jgi:lipopolysaccharide transport system ATP-binding protein